MNSLRVCQEQIAMVLAMKQCIKLLTIQLFDKLKHVRIGLNIFKAAEPKIDSILAKFVMVIIQILFPFQNSI